MRETPFNKQSVGAIVGSTAAALLSAANPAVVVVGGVAGAYVGNEIEPETVAENNALKKSSALIGELSKKTWQGAKNIGSRVAHLTRKTTHNARYIVRSNEQVGLGEKAIQPFIEPYVSTNKRPDLADTQLVENSVNQLSENHVVVAEALQAEKKQPGMVAESASAMMISKTTSTMQKAKVRQREWNSRVVSPAEVVSQLPLTVETSATTKKKTTTSDIPWDDPAKQEQKTSGMKAYSSSNVATPQPPAVTRCGASSRGQTRDKKAWLGCYYHMTAQ